MDPVEILISAIVIGKEGKKIYSDIQEKRKQELFFKNFTDSDLRSLDASDYEEDDEPLDDIEDNFWNDGPNPDDYKENPLENDGNGSDNKDTASQLAQDLKNGEDNKTIHNSDPIETKRFPLDNETNDCQDDVEKGDDNTDEEPYDNKAGNNEHESLYDRDDAWDDEGDVDKNISRYLSCNRDEEVLLPCHKKIDFYDFYLIATIWFTIPGVEKKRINIENECIKYILNKFAYTLNSCDENYRKFYNTIQQDFQLLNEELHKINNTDLLDILGHTSSIFIKMAVLLENVFLSESESNSTGYAFSTMSYDIDHVLSIVERICQCNGIMLRTAKTGTYNLHEILSRLRDDLEKPVNETSSFLSMFRKPKPKEAGWDEKYNMVCFELFVIGANKYNQVMQKFLKTEW